MNWTTGETCCGFTVTRVRSNEKIGGQMIEMVHDKTGAALCWVNNGAENKLFSVAFKTIPENDTGVFHILEHSVLCGSKRFPVREPFLELLKSSMNTFLNAMTYPDKTVYPVSSRNAQDFLNLTDVYLDAVFAPLLLENKSIFLQEGHRLELTADSAALNGVVFNEMKGAMSGVDDRIEQGIMELLFPDNCYRFNSGGDPAAIPTLTYEQFKDTYRRFYHPSNARFFLDGDLPIEETLARIDGYLSRYERAEMSFAIPLQKPRTAAATAYYAVDEEKPNRDHLAFAKLIGNFDETVRILAARVLCSLLCATNEAPLKRALLSKGLVEDVDLYVSDEMQQAYLVLAARNMSDDKEAEIRAVIKDVVNTLLRDGIPKEDLVAALNKLEFSTRQPPEPQGLVRATAALSAWLYDGDPLAPLDLTAAFNELRAMIETDGYAALLKELFCLSEDTVTLHMLPSLTLAEEEAQREQQFADARCAAMSEDDRALLRREAEDLTQWQQTEDTPEALATIPVLPLSAIDPQPQLIETQVSKEGSVTLLFHPQATNGIEYLNLYFPMTAFTLEELPLLSVVPLLLTEFPTRLHSASDLQRAIRTYIGRLSFDLTVFSKDDDPTQATPCLAVYASYLSENRAKAEALIAEVLTQTIFTDTEKILENLKQIDEDNRQSAITSGHLLGRLLARPPYTAIGAVKEAISGYSMMQAVRAAVRAFDELKDVLLNRIEKMQAAVCKASLTVGITAETSFVPLDLLNALPQGDAQPLSAAYSAAPRKRVGIRIPTPISFAVKGYYPAPPAAVTDGVLQVINNLVSYSYLWSKIRVQGGAYGAGMSAAREGIFCYSYRDPSPAESLKAYDGIAAFLRAFIDGPEALDKYIISCVSGSDPLRTPGTTGIVGDGRFFCGITDDWLIRQRRQMLETDKAAIAAWLDALDAMAADGNICVVGGESALQNCGDLEIYDC